MKVIIQYSGGKDSQASLIWAVKKYGLKNCTAVFCDTKWEHEETYDHIIQSCEDIGVELVTLSSLKYDGMIDLARKKKRFASTSRRFCTEELKIKPFIDFVLEHNEDLLVIQGIRKLESKKRASANKFCQLFKYYFEPSGYDKNGKPKFHTYRKKEIKSWCDKYSASIIRPMIDMTGKQVIEYIVRNGFEPNILYKKGSKRVGCKLCINSSLNDIENINKYHPKVIDEVEKLEKELKTSFFTTGKIPSRFCSNTCEKTGKKYPLIRDIILYKKEFTIEMFPESYCSSYYNLCEK